MNDHSKSIINLITGTIIPSFDIYHVYTTSKIIKSLVIRVGNRVIFKITSLPPIKLIPNDYIYNSLQIHYYHLKLLEGKKHDHRHK